MITISDVNIKIGCKNFTTKEWDTFDSDTISNMDSDATEFWKNHKKMIISLAKKHQKDIAK